MKDEVNDLPNNAYVIDEYNNSQVIDNNLNPDKNPNANNYTDNSENANLDYQRQPEGVDENNMDISEDDLFSYSVQEDVIFSNYSQSYNDSANEFGDSRHNVSNNTDMDIIENKVYFDHNPEKVFKDIILKLSETRFNLFLENEYLKSQLSSNIQMKDEVSENQFTGTNNMFNNIKDSKSKLNSNVTSHNFPLKPSEAKTKGKMDELVNELNNLVEMFEISKRNFGHK